MRGHKYYLLTPFLACALSVVGCPTVHREDESAVSVEGYATLADALAGNGYERVAERVRARRRPTVLLEPRGGPADARPGASRIGGTPDLPEGLAWPQAEGKSLSFIAQVNLEELAGAWPQTPLPHSGVLLFFYDAEQSVWGFDPKDKGKWAVLYASGSPAELRCATFPADLPEHARFRAKPVTPVVRDNDPWYSQIDIEDMNLSADDDDAVFDIFEAFAEKDGPIDKLFGYADEIQGEMESECQLVFHGLYTGDGSAYDDARAEALLEDAAQWKLLLQIDSDDNTGMMWGDGGRLYYWIRESDLAALKFENTWLILQCY